MMVLNLFLALMLQTPAPGQQVLVGLLDGKELAVQDPEFTGFINGRSGDAVLTIARGIFTERCL